MNTPLRDKRKAEQVSKASTLNKLRLLVAMGMKKSARIFDDILAEFSTIELLFLSQLGFK
ncbi:hypothetical protein [Acinetobacter sp. TSRC1-2]|uniref:hypothetical protein n=1 Tax=unclassified Acinetobacter TaxID=196816 RepID=UPI003CF47144